MALTDTLSGIADAIRTKTGTEGELTLAGMADAIAEIAPELDAVTASLISRTVETYENDTLETTPSSLFYYCTSLTYCRLGAATSLGSSTFFGCTALETVDLPVCTGISANCFYSTSSLAALILRSETMCEGSGSNVFSSSAVKTGTGYVYVPSELVEAYQADSFWSTYADQFRAIEDYPDVCGES